MQVNVNAPMPPIQSAAMELHSQLSNVHARIDTLVEKLAPVLKPPVPVEDSNSKLNNGASKHAEFLYGKAAEARVAWQRLDDLLARIEV